MSTEQPIPSLLHLHPTQFSSLPPHPSLPDSPSRPPLHTFIHSVLTEANTFISETVPQKFKVDKKLRSSPPSKAKVQLSSVTIPTKPGSASSQEDAGGEYWVSRQSVHEDSSELGTASFDEFVRGLRDDHTENEMAYTPSVTSIEKILEWDCETDGGFGGGWDSVKMAVTTITHTFNPSFLISPRTFLVLVITASVPTQNRQHLPGFLTLQIPLKNNDLENNSKLATAVRSKKGIFAHYASVERVMLLPTDTENSEDSTTEELGQRSIEWRTATTSNAGGWIPKRVQRSWSLGGVPKAVVHDVGLFMGWVDRERKSKGKSREQ